MSRIAQNALKELLTFLHLASDKFNEHKIWAKTPQCRLGMETVGYELRQIKHLSFL
jgi:hypothetical protein